MFTNIKKLPSFIYIPLSFIVGYCCLLSLPDDIRLADIICSVDLFMRYYLLLMIESFFNTTLPV